MLGLAAAAAVGSGDDRWLEMEIHQPGPVLYYDWEADIDTHSRRLKALKAGTGGESTDLTYYAATTPLRTWYRSLARHVAVTEASLVVIDSVMLARGGEANAADNIAFFAALRNIECRTLLLDHKSKAAMKEGTEGAYGSVINDNTVRLRWEARALGETGLSLRPSKANNHNKATLPRINLQLEGDPETSCRWEHVSSAALTQGTMTDRILAALEDNPAGFDTMGVAAEINHPTNKTRWLLNRLAEKQLIERVGDRWLMLPDPL
jgi:RecA-family ATPase